MTISMGNGSYGEIKVIGDGVVEVGKFCSIAIGVKAVTVGHNLNWVTTYPFPARQMVSKYPEGKNISGHPKRADVIIGNDVWIGCDALIIAPAYIGHGAVIGAGSVVRGFIYPYHIVYGNPIMTYGKRFTDEEIEALLRIKWWDWPEDTINENLTLLCSTDIKRFIDAHSEISKK